MGETIRNTQMTAYKGEARQRLLRYKSKFQASQKQEPVRRAPTMVQAARQRLVGG